MGDLTTVQITKRTRRRIGAAAKRSGMTVLAYTDWLVVRALKEFGDAKLLSRGDGRLIGMERESGNGDGHGHRGDQERSLARRW